jgi:hypothetical protein
MWKQPDVGGEERAGRGWPQDCGTGPDAGS